MISFRGKKKKVGPRPDWSPLGVSFKISDEHPHPFHMRSPSRDIYALQGIEGHGLKLEKIGPTFSSFSAMPAEITKTIMVSAPDEICLITST